MVHSLVHLSHKPPLSWLEQTYDKSPSQSSSSLASLVSSSSSSSSCRARRHCGSIPMASEVNVGAKPPAPASHATLGTCPTFLSNSETKSSKATLGAWAEHFYRDPGRTVQVHGTYLNLRPFFTLIKTQKTVWFFHFPR